jgi:carbamoyltransferase
MVVLGVSGRREDASVALAVDGRLVAAACESSMIGRSAAGYGAGGPPPAATAACLQRAGLRAADITTVVVADERMQPADRVVPAPDRPWGGASAADTASLRWVVPAVNGELLRGLLERPVAFVGATFAAAVQAALTTPDAHPAVIVLDATPARDGAAYAWTNGRLQPSTAIRGFGELMAAAGRFNEALGLGRGRDIEGLALLAHGESAPWAERFRSAWELNDGGIACAPGWVEAAIARAGQDIPDRLDAVSSPHRAVQERRRQLAASFSDLVAALVADVLDSTRRSAGARTIAAGGNLFGSARLNTHLREALGAALSIAPVPEPVGLALGAALAPAFLDGQAARIDCLSLGPTLSENEIKDTLDNCRLDYLYEPDWQRLLTRVSTLLARGRVVAWYQGALDFGLRSVGGRSVLCDPSNRYARDNINQYLLRRALDHPLPVALTREAAAECLEQPLIAPFTLQFAAVREACADKLKGVLDAARVCPVHGVDRAQSPEVCDLLDLHRQRTQVPGLIHITLACAGEPLAGTPRAAIRAMFSSAIDVLVMGRFLLMKDYWLLRSES